MATRLLVGPQVLLRPKVNSVPLAPDDVIDTFPKATVASTPDVPLPSDNEDPKATAWYNPPLGPWYARGN